MLEWLIENWFLVIGGIALIIALVIAICKFFGLPTKSQVVKIKEWLLYAVIECEVALGSQTGILKLRMCYDMFIAKFPIVARVISFERFSQWVDDALDRMREILKNNSAVNNFVNSYPNYL